MSIINHFSDFSLNGTPLAVQVEINAHKIFTL